MLSDSETDSNENFQITVNEHYANAYSRKKEREELSKCKLLVVLVDIKAS